MVAFFTAMFIPMWLMPYFMRAQLLYAQYHFNKLKLQPINDSNKKLYKIYPIITSKIYFFGIYLAIWIINTMLTLAIVKNDSQVPTTGNELQCEGNLPYFNVAWAIMVGISTLSAMYKLWRTEDAYDLKTELKALLILYPIGFGAYFITSFVPNAPWIGDEIVAFLCIVISFAVSIYYPIYLSYQPKWKARTSRSSSIHSMELVFSGHHDPEHPSSPSSPQAPHIYHSSNDIFREVLTNPQLLEAFKQYSVELWCAEGIQFFLLAQDYRHSFNELSSSASGELRKIKSTKEKATDLVKTFIAPSSPCLVNIDEVTQQDILKRYNAGELTSTLFSGAERTVLEQMRQDTFVKFRATGRLAKTWKAAGLGDLPEFKEKKDQNNTTKAEQSSGAVKDAPALSPTAAELLQASSENMMN